MTLKGQLRADFNLFAVGSRRLLYWLSGIDAANGKLEIAFDVHTQIAMHWASTVVADSFHFARPAHERGASRAISR